MERFRLAVVTHVLLIKDGMVLMLRRFQTGYEDGNYSLPAGHVDEAEAVSAAAIREANEECGVSIRPEDLQPIAAMHRRAGVERIDFYFAATSWTGEPWNREPDKCDDLSWYRLGALPVNTTAHVRQAIDGYLAGTWYSEFGWADSEPKSSGGGGGRD